MAQVKATKRGIRIWLEGKKLTVAGFHWHTTYTRTITSGRIDLTLVDGGELTTAGRLRNGKELPIIDISASQLDGFPAGTMLDVTYYQGTIIIKAI